MPPEPLDSAILFAPVGTLVPPALAALDRGGTLAIAGIHLSDVPAARLPAPPLRGADAPERDGEHPARRRGIPGRGGAHRRARHDDAAIRWTAPTRRCATWPTTGSNGAAVLVCLRPPRPTGPKGSSQQRKQTSLTRNEKRRRCPSRLTSKRCHRALGDRSWSSRLGHARRQCDQAVDRYAPLFPIAGLQTSKFQKNLSAGQTKGSTWSAAMRTATNSAVPGVGQEAGGLRRG